VDRCFCRSPSPVLSVASVDLDIGRTADQPLN
jgi:hypothetical protein